MSAHSLRRLRTQLRPQLFSHFGVRKASLCLRCNQLCSTRLWSSKAAACSLYTMRAGLRMMRRSRVVPGLMILLASLLLALPTAARSESSTTHYQRTEQSLSGLLSSGICCFRHSDMMAPERSRTLGPVHYKPTLPSPAHSSAQLLLASFSCQLCLGVWKEDTWMACLVCVWPYVQCRL